MLELLLKDIIQNVETEYGKPVYCHIGNSANIIRELTDLRKVNINRFPLFAFMRPFKVTDNGDNYDVTIRRVAIATVTNGTASEMKRIEENYNPELRPLNELFKNVLNEDKRIITGVLGIGYTIDEMPYFNSSIEPDAGEKMDGIVIDNLKLKINKVKLNCNKKNCTNGM